MHAEFRLLGAVTNGGIYFMSRYEMNIKDACGQVGGTPIGFGNISKPKDLYPDVNPAFPPMQWQTLDIDFRAPRFDASGTTKTENPRMTAVHNGITIYKDVELEGVKGSTAKLGSAGVGSIYLQEHGTAYQFRNIWVVDKTVKGTEKFGDAAAIAAEIMRGTYGDWSDSDIAKFQNMLRVQYLPSIIHGDCENGNKELAMCEALVNIGVILEDRAVFDLGLKMWRGRTPAYIYLKSDGPKPIEPPGCGPAIWSNKGLMPELVDGILQETARDAHHPWLAFSSMANAAETARQQGVDLYGEEGKRMMAALEFQAQYISPNSVTPPENLQFALQPTWEIAYNHFHNRMGVSLPKMGAVIPTNRPTGANHHMNWETLTHGEMGAIGIPPIHK